MSTKERAAQMRKEFKANGWNARKVSVRVEYYSMGSSIHVTVKDPTVDVAKAKEIAKAGESIDRCEITHEILSGGNCFVHFGLSDEVEKALAAPFLTQVEAAVKELRTADRNSLVKVEGTNAMIGNGRFGDYAQLWIDDRAGMEYPIEYGVERLALDLALAQK